MPETILTFHRDSRNKRVAKVLVPTGKKDVFPFHKSKGVPALFGLTLKEEDFKKYSGLHVAIKFDEPCEVVGSGADPETARQEAHTKGMTNLPVVFVQPKVFKELR